jgi:hypothetical protein
MIAQAFDTTHRCTCDDAFAGDILPCPAHGMAHRGSRSAHPEPDPVAVFTRDYAAGLHQGFREGVEAAMKMMGVK